MRNAKFAPFCWQEKAALRALARHFSEGKQHATARSVYVALSQIASDEKSQRFQKPVPYIAMIAGIGVRTLQEILPVFKEIGLINIEPQFEKGAQVESFYTLLQITPPAQPLHHPSADSAPPGANTALPPVQNLRPVKTTDAITCGHIEESSEERNSEAVAHWGNAQRLLAEDQIGMEACQ